MKKRLSALLLFLLLIGSGCWSRREINDLGVVVTLGVDLDESGQLEVTMGIAQPAAAVGGHGTGGGGGGGSSTGGGGGSAGEPRAVVIRTGKTLAEAVREAELMVPRRLTLQHLQVIILGERFAERGVNTLTDYLLRNPEVRLSTRIMILKGASIREMLGQPPIVERLQAQVLHELATARVGLVRKLKEFLIARSTPHQSPVLPVVSLKGEFRTSATEVTPTPELSGVAVFKDDRVAAYLDAEMTRGFIWLVGSARDAIVTAECPDKSGKYLSARVYDADRRVQPVMRGSRAGFNITIGGTLHIAETQCGIDLLDPVQLQAVQSVLQRRIKERVEEVIRITQAVPADPFNFGQYLRAGMPQVWNRVSSRWPAEWADTPVRLDIRVKVTHTQGSIRVPNWRAFPPPTP